MNEYYFVWIVIIAIILIVVWWTLSVVMIEQPVPPRPDGNFRLLIDELDTFPKELWFRNSPCIFKKFLDCSDFRYIIYESNGEVVYNSKPDNRFYIEDPEQLISSVEYIRAVALLEGVVLRGKTENVAQLIKEGDRYRIVHVSNYIYSEEDSIY